MYHRTQFGLFPSGLTGFTRRLDEKSTFFWMFCRWSRLRSMSYSPLLSFGSSITVPGSTYLLLHLSVLECLTSRGPGRWPGQSGKELGLTERFLHSLVEQHAAEVSRLNSGVLYDTDH